MSFDDLKNRRAFLRFLGRSTASLAVISSLPKWAGPLAEAYEQNPQLSLPFTPLAPSYDDQLLLSEGFGYEVLIGWGGGDQRERGEVWL